MKILSFYLLLISSAFCQDWKVVTHEEREYVSLQQVADFYELELKEGGILRNDQIILKFAAGESTATMNGISCILQAPIVELEAGLSLSASDMKNLIDPVLHPNKYGPETPFTTVVLDPAYGGEDSGPVLPDGKASASDRTLAIAREISNHLEKAGIKVVRTRDGDQALTTAERIKTANDVPNSIYIRLEFSDAQTLPGMRTNALILPEKSAAPAKARSAIGLACVTSWSVANSLEREKLKPANQGFGYTDSEDFAALQSPGISIVLGKLTDPGDLAILEANSATSTISRTIAGSVLSYQKATTAK